MSNLLEPLTNPLHVIREQMSLYGGSFVQALSKLMRVADPDNMALIIATWPSIVKQYDDMATAGAEIEAAQPVIRYFSDAGTYWKFEKGKRPLHRYADESKWVKSGFSSFATFSDKPGNAVEVTAEQAEPKIPSIPKR